MNGRLLARSSLLVFQRSPFLGRCFQLAAQGCHLTLLYSHLPLGLLQLSLQLCSLILQLSL